MTTDNNMFDVSGWFRGPVNKKMMLPDNESMFGGIDYWISRPVFNDQVVIEMSFSVSHQSLKTDDLLLLFEGFKYDYEKMIRSAFRNENDSMNLRSHEFSGVVFMTPIGLHSMRTTLFKVLSRDDSYTKSLNTEDWCKDFSYQNYGDLIDNVSSEEWRRREKFWSSVHFSEDSDMGFTTFNPSKTEVILHFSSR